MLIAYGQVREKEEAAQQEARMKFEASIAGAKLKPG